MTFCYAVRENTFFSQLLNIEIIKKNNQDTIFYINKDNLFKTFFFLKKKHHRLCGKYHFRIRKSSTKFHFKVRKPHFKLRKELFKRGLERNGKNKNVFDIDMVGSFFEEKKKKNLLTRLRHTPHKCVFFFINYTII